MPGAVLEPLLAPSPFVVRKPPMLGSMQPICYLYNYMYECQMTIAARRM